MNHVFHFFKGAPFSQVAVEEASRVQLAKFSSEIWVRWMLLPHRCQRELSLHGTRRHLWKHNPFYWFLCLLCHDHTMKAGISLCQAPHKKQREKVFSPWSLQSKQTKEYCRRVSRVWLANIMLAPWFLHGLLGSRCIAFFKWFGRGIRARLGVEEDLVFMANLAWGDVPN